MGILHANHNKASGEKGYAPEWNANHIIEGDFDFNHYSGTNQVIESRTDYPAGPVEGQIIYRSDLNELQVYDGSAWLVVAGIDDINRCYSYLVGSVTATANIERSVPLHSDLYDLNEMHNATIDDTKIYIKEEGYYLIIGRIFWADTATGGTFLTAKIKKNAATILDTDIIPTNGDAAFSRSNKVEGIYYLEAGDYVELYATSGNDDLAMITNTFLNVWRIGV